MEKYPSNHEEDTGVIRGLGRISPESTGGALLTSILTAVSGADTIAVVGTFVVTAGMVATVRINQNRENRNNH